MQYIDNKEDIIEGGKIVVTGTRVHNLQNIDVEIPVIS